MLLDRDHRLLRDEAVPAAQRLGVVRGIGVIGGHVGAHDARGVTSDVEAGAELVLGANTGDAFAADAVPGADIVEDEAAGLRHVFLKIGRAAGRERVCKYVEISGVAVSLKKKKIKK